MSKISAGLSNTTAIKVTGDTTGNLVIETNGNVVAATFDTNQNVNFANSVTVTGTLNANVSGNGATLTNINASNITSGTISNAYTTANSSNGASTIVARDSNGSFTANVVAATNVNSTNVTATVGSFTNVSGNGVALTAINASNVTSGTLDNARTSAASANGASTIVARDTNGSFAANVVSATTGSFTNVSGNGAALTGINASNITSGTISNDRTSAASANGASTIVARDSNGSFAANVGTFTSISGNGAALTGINASNLSAGTVSSDRVSGSYTGITGVGTLTAGTWNANVVSAQYGGTGSANLTAENVVLGNGANAVKVVAPGTANNVLTSNGTTWISQAPTGGGSGFTAGTVMLFGQTSAPTGWTKDTTNYNNSALRVVTGTASTGGSVDFTTAFASSRAVTISSITGSAGATTLSTPQIPSHNHDAFCIGGTAPNRSTIGSYAGNSTSQGVPTSSTGGGGSHDHPFSFSSGSGSVNLEVKYVDVIRATKD